MIITITITIVCNNSQNLPICGSPLSKTTEHLFNDLGRIGDYAVNIAESILTLRKKSNEERSLELPLMAELVQATLRNTIDGSIHKDPHLGILALEQDDRTDTLNRLTTQEIIDSIKSKKNTIEEGMELIRVCKNLECVGDLVTNIAEEFIFVTQAVMIKRHSTQKVNLKG